MPKPSHRILYLTHHPIIKKNKKTWNQEQKEQNLKETQTVNNKLTRAPHCCQRGIFPPWRVQTRCHVTTEKPPMPVLPRFRSRTQPETTKANTRRSSQTKPCSFENPVFLLKKSERDSPKESTKLESHYMTHNQTFEPTKLFQNYYKTLKNP